MRLIVGVRGGTVVLDWLVRLVAVTVITGTATFYSSGTMQHVYERRLQWGHVQPCQECVGYVALLDCEHLGKRAWLQHPNGQVVGPLLVVDCAARQDRARLQRRGLAVEVSWEQAKRWGMRGPLAGMVVVVRE